MFSELAVQLRALDGVISVAVPGAHVHGDAWLVFVDEEIDIPTEWPKEMGGKPVLLLRIPRETICW